MSFVSLDNLEEGASARLWDLSKGRPNGMNAGGLVVRVRNETKRNKQQTFLHCTFSPHGDELVSVDDAGNAFAFRVLGGSISRLARLGRRVQALAFSPHLPRQVLLALDAREVCVLDLSKVATGAKPMPMRLSGHKHPVHSIAYHPSWNLVALASIDRLTLWDTTTWKNTKKLGGGTGIVQARFSSRGDLLFVAFRNSDIFAWGVSSFELLLRLTPKVPLNQPTYTSKACNLTCFCLSPDSRFAVAGGKSRLIFVWEIHARALVRVVELPESVSAVLQVEFLVDNFSVAVLADDGILRVLQVVGDSTSKILFELSHDSVAFLSFALSSPHSSLLAACLSDGTLALHDLDAARAFKLRNQRTKLHMGIKEEAPFLANYSVFQSDGDRLDERSDKYNSYIRDTQTLRRTSQENNTEENETSAKEGKEALPLHETVNSLPQASDDALQQQPTHVPVSSPVDISTPHVVKQQPPLLRLAKQISKEDSRLNRERLVKLLRDFGEFPENYRTLIWRFLLALPENASAYAALVKRGSHPAWSNLYELFPVRGKQVFARFERILFALAHWCPVFEQVSYLPALVFPFVKVFGTDELAAFETIVTVLFQVTGGWFETFPHLPVFVLARIEKLLQKLDPELLKHFTERQVTSEVYAWSLLRSLFSQVLSKNEWLGLWDHVLTKIDSSICSELLEAACVAYVRYFRNTLLSFRRQEDFETFFRRQNPLNTKRFIAAVMRVHRENARFWVHFADQAISQKEGKSTLPEGRLPKGDTYPAFTRYPSFTVDYEAMERKRIRMEEDALLAKQKLAQEIRAKTEALAQKEEQHINFQEYLLRVEEENRRKQSELDEKRLRELERVEKVMRLRRLEQIDKLEDLASSNLELQQKLRKAELERQESELAHRAKMSELQISAAHEEEKVQGLESQAFLKLRGLHNQRELEQEMQSVRLHASQLTKQAELDWKLKEEAWKLEDERRKLERALRTEEMERSGRIREVTLTRRSLETNFLSKQVEERVKMSEVERRRLLRHFEEDITEESQVQFEKRLELERLLAEEEKRQRLVLEQQVEDMTRKLSSEREALIAQERRKVLQEAQERDKRLASLEQLQAKRQFEEESSKVLRKARERLDEEERELYNQLLALDEGRRQDSRVESELLRKEQHLRERLQGIQQARRKEEEAVRQERARFQDLRFELEAFREKDRQHVTEHDQLLRHAAQVRGQVDS